jgi:hypothetical protein
MYAWKEKEEEGVNSLLSFKPESGVVIVSSFKKFTFIRFKSFINYLPNFQKESQMR